jgi:hypothetical protein
VQLTHFDIREGVPRIKRIPSRPTVDGASDRKEDRMPIPPKLLLLVIGLISSAVAFSAIGTIAAFLLAGPHPVWFLFGFELVIAITAPMGMLFAMGRFQDGQGLGLACLSGTIAVGSLLGWMGADRHLITSHGDISLKFWLAGRLAAAAALGAMGVWLVLSRNQRSWYYLIRAAACGLPLAGLLCVYVFGRGALGRAVGAIPGWITGTLGAVGAVVAIALISAGVHCLIRAFEMGRIENETDFRRS